MNKTAVEEEILGEVNKLKRLWGIEEPLRLSGGFYQNYCNLSVTNRKLRKKKRQTWAGVLTQELGYLPETETEWLEAFNLTGVLPPPKFKKLRNRLWDYDDCIELLDLSDPVGESLMGNRSSARHPRPWLMICSMHCGSGIGWTHISIPPGKKSSTATMVSPRTRADDCSWSVEDLVMIYPTN